MIKGGRGAGRELQLGKYFDLGGWGRVHWGDDFKASHGVKIWWKRKYHEKGWEYFRNSIYTRLTREEPSCVWEKQKQITRTRKKIVQLSHLSEGGGVVVVMAGSLRVGRGSQRLEGHGKRAGTHKSIWSWRVTWPTFIQRDPSGHWVWGTDKMTS